MKNLFKIITIFLFCILSVQPTYADEFDEDEPKFSCIYEDFQLDTTNSNKGLQVDVYKGDANLIVYYKDSAGNTKTYNLEEDCGLDLTECEEIWDKPGVVLNIPNFKKNNYIDHFYDRKSPYCPNVVVQRGNLSKNGLVIRFGKSNSSTDEDTTEYLPRYRHPHGSSSGGSGEGNGEDTPDEVILECTKENKYNYNFGTSKVPNASNKTINFELFKKKSGKIIVRVNYGSTLNEYVVGEGGHKELGSGDSYGNAKVGFDKFGTFDKCPNPTETYFCEENIEGEDFHTFLFTLDPKNCKRNISSPLEKIEIDSKTDQLKCESIFKGNLQKYIEKIFSLMKYAGIILCIGLSIYDFVKALLNNDKDSLSKITKKVFIRLILVAVLFMLPTLVNFVISIIDENACKINF